MFKLWLAANDRPRVNADDAAMWRRILQLPFVNVIPEAERDERVKLALRNDPAVQTAILAWAVQGCLEWQERGLDVPDVVRDYTAVYRAEQDPLRDWLADCCVTDPDAWTTTAALRVSYEPGARQRRTPDHREETRNPPRRQRLPQREVRRHARKDRNPCQLNTPGRVGRVGRRIP